jgi:hypothetical protein
MDRPNDDRANFEPSNPGFDPDEAISRYLAKKTRRKSSEAQAEEVFDAEPDSQDDGEEESEPQLEKPPEHHPHRTLQQPFLTHRPTFGRKGL